ELSNGVKGDVTRVVGALHKSYVGAGLESSVEGDAKSTTVGKQVLDIDGNYTVDVEKDFTSEFEGDDAEHTEKILSFETEKIALKADKLTFSVNDQLLFDLAKSGAFKINGAKITLDGPFTTKGSKIDKTAAGSIPSNSITPPKPEELEAAKG